MIVNSGVAGGRAIEQLPNAEKSWYICMFEDPSGVIVTQCLLLWSDQVIQKNEPTIFFIKSMIIIVMITAQCYFSSKYSLFYAIFSLLMLIHYGFCTTDVFFYIKYSNIWKITNIFVKQYKKSKRVRPDLEPVCLIYQKGCLLGGVFLSFFSVPLMHMLHIRLVFFFLSYVFWTFSFLRCVSSFHIYYSWWEMSSLSVGRFL